MTRNIFLAVTALLFLSSCRKDDSRIAMGQAVMGGPVEVATSSGEKPIVFNRVIIVHHSGTQVYNPCTQEMMTLYGDVQFRSHGVTNDHNSISTENANAKGLIAVGESGTEYTISGAARIQGSDYVNGISTFKFRVYNRFITPGGENNYLTEQIFYLKVDAEGNTSYIIEPISETSCQ